MAASKSVHLLDLAKKLRLLDVYCGLKVADIAKRVGRSESTLSEWMRGTALRKPEMVPADALELLSKLLIDVLPGSITIEKARRLWLGPLRAFAQAFVASTEESFLSLLESKAPAPLLEYLPDGIGDLRVVNFFRAGAVGPVGVTQAKVGDLFALRITAPENSFVVLIVETVIGRHLAIPNPEHNGRGNAREPMRIPDSGCLPFEGPSGLHRFLAFVLVRDEPPEIWSLLGQTRPLVSDDMDMLVNDLSDCRATREWSWGQFFIDIES